MNPELWLVIGKPAQRAMRAEWQADDPDAFAAQEERRSSWRRAKRGGVVACGVVAGSGELPGSSSVSDGHVCVPRALAVRAINDDPAVSSDGGLAAQRSRRRCVACVETLVQQARALIMSGTHGHVFLELCCSSDSELAAAAVEHSVAIRVTTSEDLRLASTWCAIPCTVGTHFRWINDTYKLVVAAIGLCRHAVRIGGGFCWEWTNDNEFRDLVIVRNFFAKCDTSSCLVSTAAVGQQFVDSEGSVSYVKKKLKIVTTRPKLIEVMAPYARLPEQLGPADFRPCCEKVCADSAFYTPFFAELVWRALRTVVVMPARNRADLVPEGCFPASKPSMPLWCAMLTRTISLMCEEAQEPEAKEAMAKEVAYYVERGTWDISRVRELSGWMRDDAYTEVLVGRLFVALGVKFAELAKSEQKFRARAVYQGNNIWSRSGRSVYEIFDEVSNSPSSLTAARTAMAVGMMRGMRASYRDASNAVVAGFDRCRTWCDKSR